MAKAEKRYRGIYIVTAFFGLVSACFMAIYLQFGNKEIFHDFNMTFEAGKK